MVVNTDKKKCCMKRIITNLFCLVFILFISCKEENLLQPYGGDENAIPGAVSNVRVENIPGGAVIRYDLPKDADLLYVKAVYKTTHGTEQSVSASGYVDSVKIVGLGNTNDYLVKLYAINHMEKASVPVEVTITPQVPPVQLVYESLNHSIDFGGFVVTFDNKTKSDIAIYILRVDSTGKELEYYDAMYTSMEIGKFPVRGLPNKENTFGIYVRDRYDNMSDTLLFTGIPMREDALNKALFKDILVPGDVKWDFYSASPTRAWDDIVSNGNYAHTDFPIEFPHRITIDLGVEAKLSRFRFWQRPGDDVLYQHGAPKHYKVYGRTNKPEGGSASDPLAGWTLLMECNSFKPSGLPLGQNSSEDVEFASKGEEFSFPRDIPNVRYLRFEMLESWSGMKCSTIGELAFWGEIQ